MENVQPARDLASRDLKVGDEVDPVDRLQIVYLSENIVKGKHLKHFLIFSSNC